MPTVAVLGGSVIGGATALLLARAGWQVTVVDPEHDLLVDAERPTAPRPGAPHTAQAHGFPSRAPHELRTRLPDVYAALIAAGAEAHPFEAPPHLMDGGRPDDSDLDSFRTRRRLLDQVVAESVRREPGVRVVPLKATGLLLQEGDPPRALGYSLADGTAVTADVLVDAAGRRSPVSGWLAAAGIEQPGRRDECGLAYYGRHARITGPRPRLNNGFADIHEFSHHLQLMFVGDNDTVQLALSPHSSDRRLTVLRHEDAFWTTLAANEDFADWLDVLEPITPVFCLGSLQNRMHGLVADHRPLVLGLHQVGDALATTNPNRGRGISMGLAAVGALVDTLARHQPGIADAMLELDAWQRDVLAVYYREAADVDHTMGRRLRASLLGADAPANAPAMELPAGHPVTSAEIERAAMLDPDVFRAFLRTLNVLDDRREIASEGMTARVRAVLATAGNGAPGEPRRTRLLDDRAALEELLAPWPG